METQQSENSHMDGETINAESPKKKASSGLFLAHADSKDILLMSLGSLGCMADGATTPLIMLALSRITNNLAANPSSLTLHGIKQVRNLSIVLILLLSDNTDFLLCILPRITITRISS